MKIEIGIRGGRVRLARRTKRLMFMIVSSSALGRSAAPQDRTGEASGGPVGAVLASLIQRPRKLKT